jgi:hypothetical protein
MARKRVFTSPKDKEVFLGGRKRSFSYPDEAERQEERPRDRAPADRLRGQAEPRDRARGSAKQPRDPGRTARAARVRKRNVRLGLLLTAGLVLFLLIWFFVAVYPSPIGNLSPLPQAIAMSRVVDVGASFKKTMKQDAVALLVDGKDVTDKASVSGKTVTCRMDLADGRHVAKVVVDGGGLMGKRSKVWAFSVDSTPPKLTILNKKVTDLKGSSDVQVSFAGVADPGATVKVAGKVIKTDAKGNFKGEVETTRERSLDVAAADGAGNVSRAYIVTQKPVAAKGAHVSIFMAASDTDMAKLIGMVDRTELNALEIDLKDEWGQIGFDLDNSVAKQVKSTTKYLDLDAVVDRMRYQDVYAICRIVSFKDPKLAKGRPDLAVLDKNGGPWSKGVWLDPYSKEVWDYNVSVAVAAARAGFNEVQFDYVRFPSDGNTANCVYPHQDGRSQGEVIDGFISYAQEKLAPYNVFISADLFGLTASKQGDMGIGQNVKDIAHKVDYISPMVYPSHYNAGEYDIKVPEANPHDIVLRSLQDFKKVTNGAGAALRPWLQDFSLRITYTPEMVRRQINACIEAGVNQWLLWDPECTYSESALKPESKPSKQPSKT